MHGGPDRHISDPACSRPCISLPTPQEMLVERLYVDLEASLCGEFVAAREGIMTVPDGPGLG